MIRLFIGLPVLIVLFWAGGPVTAQTAGALDGQEPERSSFVIHAGARFRDCGNCPEMVVIPAGRFDMGSPEEEDGRSSDEGPLHEVVFLRAFAIGRFEINVGEWKACVEAQVCPVLPESRRDMSDVHPVANVNWEDAQQYVRWLSDTTGKKYRLPSEAEWEYAARGATSTPYFWGNPEEACAFANVYDVTGREVYHFKWPHFACIDANVSMSAVGAYKANGFGLHDMLGNVWEWVEDCWNDSYAGAPENGQPLLTGDCEKRIVRGGSWKNIPWGTRSAFRSWQNASDRVDANGFRVARFSE